MKTPSLFICLSNPHMQRGIRMNANNYYEKHFSDSTNYFFLTSIKEVAKSFSLLQQTSKICEPVRYTIGTIHDDCFFI